MGIWRQAQYVNLKVPFALWRSKRRTRHPIPLNRLCQSLVMCPSFREHLPDKGIFYYGPYATSHTAHRKIIPLLRRYSWKDGQLSGLCKYVSGKCAWSWSVLTNQDPRNFKSRPGSSHFLSKLTNSMRTRAAYTLYIYGSFVTQWVGLPCHFYMLTCRQIFLLETRNSRERYITCRRLFLELQKENMWEHTSVCKNVYACMHQQAHAYTVEWFARALARVWMVTYNSTLHQALQFAAFSINRVTMWKKIRERVDDWLRTSFLSFL